MRSLFLLFIICSSSFYNSLFAQIIVKGTVIQQNKPLEGAAVYFNNTTQGTITNSNGEFSIKINEGQFQLIISFLGYKTINYSFNTATYTKPLVFNLVEQVTNLYI